MNNKTRWLIILVDGIICILNGMIGIFSLLREEVIFPLNIFISGMFFSACIYEVVIIFLKKQKDKYEAILKEKEEAHKEHPQKEET